MKSPMNMAPNKMVSPAKQKGDLNKDGKMSGYENARQNAIEKNTKKDSVLDMKSPMQMSPAKMGSAYKLDKSGFKMKSASVNMRTPGSVAKMAGVSPAKHKPWTEAHKGNAAHPNTAEAHNAKPADTDIKKFTDGKDGAVSRGNSASNVSR